jgi:hypothetical protein
MPELPSFAALEDAEAESWTEAHEQASPSYKERVGFRIQRVAGALSIFAREDLAAFNRVWLPGEADVVTPRALFEVIEFARSLGRARFLVHCPTWAACSTLMMEHGFAQRPPVEKLFRRACANVPDGPLRVEQVGAEQAELAGRMITEGYDLEPWMHEGYSSTIGRPGWKHYFAFDGGQPVATAAMRVRGEFAWLGFATTFASHRGRGAQLSLLYRRVRDAAEAGCQWVIAEAMPDGPSLRNQLRAGFEIAYERPNYTIDLR